MVRLDWQWLFGNGQRLRCHGKRKMADNRTNGMLMPVIDGKIWAPIGRFQQSKLAKVNFSTLIVIAGGRLRGSIRLSSITERGQAKTSRDHPQQEMRPEVPSA